MDYGHFLDDKVMFEFNMWKWLFILQNKVEES